VGGRAAKHVVVIVRNDVGCDPGFFYNWKAQTGGALWVRTELGDTIRMWIVEVDGTLLFIAGETHRDVRPGEALTEAGQARIEEEIQQIVDSIRFGDPDPLLAEDVNRADAICKAANRRFFAEVGILLGSSELGDIAAVHEGAARISEQVLAELRALPPSEAERARLAEAYPILEETVELLRQIAVAARAGDAAYTETLDRERVGLTHSKDASFMQYGLGWCPVVPGA
jgi:hypothetical protein